MRSRCQAGEGDKDMTNRDKLEKERDRVFDGLETAARMVGQRDGHILEGDLREEAIIDRLAHYLELILLDDKHLNLDNYSVDCEYNGGSGYRRKYLQIRWPKGSQSQLRKRDQHVRPDIIVHERGVDGVLNLLMVEVKKVLHDRSGRAEVRTFEVRGVPAFAVGSFVLGLCLLHNGPTPEAGCRSLERHDQVFQKMTIRLRPVTGL